MAEVELCLEPRLEGPTKPEPTPGDRLNWVVQQSSYQRIGGEERGGGGLLSLESPYRPYGNRLKGRATSRNCIPRSEEKGSSNKSVGSGYLENSSPHSP